MLRKKLPVEIGTFAHIASPGRGSRGRLRRHSGLHSFSTTEEAHGGLARVARRRGRCHHSPVVPVLTVIGVLVVCGFALKGFFTWREEAKARKEQARRRRVEKKLADAWGMPLYSDGFLLRMREVNNSENDGSDEWKSVWALGSFGYSDEFLSAMKSRPDSFWEDEDEEEEEDEDDEDEANCSTRVNRAIAQVAEDEGNRCAGPSPKVVNGEAQRARGNPPPAVRERPATLPLRQGVNRSRHALGGL